MLKKVGESGLIESFYGLILAIFAIFLKNTTNKYLGFSFILILSILCLFDSKMSLGTALIFMSYGGLSYYYANSGVLYVSISCLILILPPVFKKIKNKIYFS